ncbi:MAG: dihydroorotate dehydrogenase [Fimbriimonadales bacterium]|nr:MAG: dihydroorotate dehydrogenase [Fimbriimonadales bacterium]
MAVGLEVALGRLQLRNPVMVAAGTFGYGLEYRDLVELSRLGALVTKSLTLAPRMGNPPPRVAETPAGMLNAIGLQNDGVDAFCLETLPRLREYDTPIIASVAGETLEEYVQVAEKISRAEGVAALELNLSCPNQSWGGIEFGVSPELTAQVVAAVRQATELPLIAKLTPNVSDLTPIAQAAVEAGAEILSLINTVLGVAVDAKTRQFRLGSVVGGLSGPAIKPIAQYHLWRVRQALPHTPLIGVGGIASAEDAIEYLLLGAHAIQVGTANYVQPTLALEVLEGIHRYLAQNGFDSVNAIRGSVCSIERGEEP